MQSSRSMLPRNRSIWPPKSGSDRGSWRSEGKLRISWRLDGMGEDFSLGSTEKEIGRVAKSCWIECS